MENKYYTPSIEEFNVGFRYEWRFDPKEFWKSGEATWIKKEYNQCFIENPDTPCQNINENDIRVKYLDREDIEELGWCFVREIFNSKLDEYVHPNEGESGRTLRVYKDINDFIKYGVDIGIGYMDFYGESYNIKNYNELKKVMELIGII